ncbi:Membrane protein of uncharacterised function [Chlamydia trachomatis]|nr:Membrane protein of uncharacterised function [Chlamydia trachomatis]
MPAGGRNRVFVVTFAQGVPRNSRGRARLQSFSIYSWRGSAGAESRNDAREKPPADAEKLERRQTGSMEFILRLIATMAGIWVATLIVPSINFADGTSLASTLIALAVIALVFTLVNSLIKPLVKVLAFPLYILTFGLFAIVTDALLFMLTGALSTSIGIPFETGGFWASFFGAVITAIVSSPVAGLIGAKKDK